MTNNCGCRSINNLSAVNIPMADEFAAMRELFPALKLGKDIVKTFEASDLQAHRFRGGDEADPLSAVRLFSCQTEPPTDVWAERRYIGRAGDTKIDVTTTVRAMGGDLFEYEIRSRDLGVEGDTVTLTIDAANRLIVDWTPELNGAAVSAAPETRTPFQKTIGLTGSGVFLLTDREECIALALGAAAVSCGGLLALGPLGAGAFLICAGPAVVAAVTLC